MQAEKLSIFFRLFSFSIFFPIFLPFLKNNPYLCGVTYIGKEKCRILISRKINSYYKFMRKTLLLALSLLTMNIAKAEEVKIAGPDGNLQVIINDQEGIPTYSVNYKGKTMVEKSPLGLITNVGDFSKNMTLSSKEQIQVEDCYSLKTIKTSHIHYQANEITCTLTNPQKRSVNVVFRISNNDVAFKYVFPKSFGDTRSCVIKSEATGFDFPSNTTTFLCEQALPMTGWMRTKPSYEEPYKPDAPMGEKTSNGCGYTFPCLFHVGENGWVLVSETGVSSLYCASHLSEGTTDGKYFIEFPHKDEMNGLGSSTPGISLPGETPWRTLTVGDNLKPIVETTVAFDVVKPLYEASQEYEYGRSVWPWIMWQDNAVNYEDTKAYIELAVAMGWEYILIDGLWDKQIGYKRVEELIRLAQSKGIDVFMWYNSNGYWNDAPQGPRQRMNTSIARKEEMKWLKKMGVKGLKVDFFGSDKQEMMKVYEDILSDANDYGLMIIFHGCTLPRGWERMYPNYVGSEAVLASENLIFTQEANDNEAFNACLHPFIRNTVGSMEFGGTLLNKRHNRTNDGGRIRRTTDVFQLATAVLYQNPIQNFALAPNNLTDAPAIDLEFMKQVPTIWDETRFIDGYPGKYCVLARRHANTWYVVGINATKEPLKLKADLSMFAPGTKVIIYDDEPKTLAPQKKELKLKKKNSIVTLQIAPQGGIIVTQ